MYDQRTMLTPQKENKSKKMISYWKIEANLKCLFAVLYIIVFMPQ